MGSSRKNQRKRMTTESSPARAQILRKSTVVERVAASPSTIYRWERAGLFPKHVQLGPNMIGWREADIEAWIAQRAESRKETEENSLVPVTLNDQQVKEAVDWFTKFISTGVVRTDIFRAANDVAVEDETGPRRWREFVAGDTTYVLMVKGPRTQLEDDLRLAMLHRGLK